MKDKDKKKFEEWYQVQTGTFDFKKELLEYCQSVRRSRNSFHKKPASTRLKSVQPSRQRGTNCNSNSWIVKYGLGPKKYVNLSVDTTAQFHAVLEQGREARTSDDLGVQLMEALYKAIKDQIAPDARPQDLLHFVIHAHGFTHAFRSSNIRVGDFLRRDTYTDELLDTLAGKLNSNESFHRKDGFQLDITLLRGTIQTLKGPNCCREVIQALNKLTWVPPARKRRGWITNHRSRSLRRSETTQAVGLFADYVNTWLKIKQESAGWSRWSKLLFANYLW